MFFRKLNIIIYFNDFLFYNKMIIKNTQKKIKNNKPNNNNNLFRIINTFS